jgi:hypothetical protein
VNAGPAIEVMNVGAVRRLTINGASRASAASGVLSIWLPYDVIDASALKFNTAATAVAINLAF